VRKIKAVKIARKERCKDGEIGCNKTGSSEFDRCQTKRAEPNKKLKKEVNTEIGFRVSFTTGGVN
jgi:hypothetical protein